MREFLGKIVATATEFRVNVFVIAVLATSVVMVMLFTGHTDSAKAVFALLGLFGPVAMKLVEPPADPPPPPPEDTVPVSALKAVIDKLQ